MLAGDCATAVDAAAMNGANVAPATSDANLVFVDSDVQDLGQLLNGISADHEIVLLDSSRGGIEQISETLQGRRGVASIHLLAHGHAGQIQLGSEQVDLATIESMRSQSRGWSASLASDADILIYGCETGAGDLGQRFIQRLAQLTGADVAASEDRTGSARAAANWDLEYTVGTIEASLALDAAALANYPHTLPISIRAAGDRGEEQMQLQIDGVTVASWDNIGGNASANDFLTFTHDVDGISANQIRVVFTNDLYDPANGIDRNLRVDNITVDGRTFETESSDVFSTGTWKAADGVTPGFRESEALHTDGYFQYADEVVEPPTVDATAIINEIHYNPGPDGAIDGDAEFLELYNPGSEDFDLSGASFSGFDLTFAEGTSLGAGQYAIVAPSIAIAETEWGVTPIAEFAAGGLSGGGETIQLIAADGVTIIDEVSYDDVTPWPGGPDGNGPSLELVNPSFDNAEAASWGTSDPNPTPAAQNSIFSEVAAPDITGITLTPGQPLPNQAFTVSATIPDATFATLTFKIMFDDDQSVAMTNIGGDVWEATVPGQAAGTLVRYRIDSDVATAPFEEDTINYLGVVVSPTDIVDNTLPVLQWFVEPEAFEELVTDLFLTNTRIPAVIAFGDQVIDNAEVRVRGSGSRFAPKKGFKIELPSGYTLDLGPLASTPVDEFGIVADFSDWSVASAQIAWEVWNAETGTPTTSFFTRVEQNGEFYGVYRFQELYDGAWRTANGYADGEFYQAESGGWIPDEGAIGFDQKEPGDDDFTNVLAARDILTSPNSAAKTQWLYDNVDVPAAINHMALTALTRHFDQYGHNFYVALDGETDRWSLLEWDLDLAWRDVYSLGAGQLLTTPQAIGSVFMNSVFSVPEFEAMYWQRLETLVDQYLSTDQLIERRAELIADIGATNSALEFAAWGRNDIFDSSYHVDQWQNTIDSRRDVFAAETRLPGSTLTDPAIVINELHYNPSGADAEFLELFNASDQAVDLSGWSIDGVGLTIAAGTVILPGDYVVFTDADPQFRSQTTGNIFVGGQYSGGLSGGGETITLLDQNGNVIDQVAYDDVAPWPTQPDGDGFTLALIDPTADNNVASNWAASQQLGGTPGSVNEFSAQQPTTIKIFAAGSTANEIIELEIAGVVVASFNMAANGGSAGDYQSRNFIELTFESQAAVAASDVRVNFVNDLYDPANGIDFNVRIDRIEIDAVAYETEDPSVFSTGTWLSGVGITPGFKLSEALHGNGYFQFDALV
ncbi:MAG: DUF4347 domain-containing protein [Rubripirellula sp.]